MNFPFTIHLLSFFSLVVMSTLSYETIIIIAVVILMIIFINIIYLLFHLYMRKKNEFETRLLNILYSHLAVWYQVGSLVNFFLILRGLHLIHFGKKQSLKAGGTYQYFRQLWYSLHAVVHSFLQLAMSCSYSESS